MKFQPTGFEGLIEIQPKMFTDARGYFFEEFNRDRFVENGIDIEFLQSNQSFSRQNVIRGLHLQISPYEQAKFVRVISGSVLDIVVDLRPKSKTFGLHYKCILKGETGNMLYVPKGFAHGFAALEDTVFHYICDNTYHPNYERGIRWDDKDLNIDWEIKDPIISQKDVGLPTFEEFKNKELTKG